MCMGDLKTPSAACMLSCNRMQCQVLIYAKQASGLETGQDVCVQSVQRGWVDVCSNSVTNHGRAAWECFGRSLLWPPTTNLRTYCQARLCWRKPLSAYKAAEFTILLKAWYLMDAWLHQAGIYHERLTSVKASLLSPIIWHLIKEQ